MFGQTFDLSDIPRLLSLILIEVLLSADNALVLAVLINPLSGVMRRKALILGVASAFFFRAIAICAVSLILKSIWLKLLGAAYLFYLCIHHFIKKSRPPSRPTLASLWKTILIIELIDLSFAMDSIVAGIAFISAIPETSHFLHPKIWIVYLGGIIGLIMIRYAAEIFSRLIDRFPGLSNSAYLLVGWVGVKLALDVLTPKIPHFEFLFWPIFFLIILLGFLRLPEKTKKD